MAYRLTLVGARVKLAGQLPGGAASSGAFVLPAGFRPTKTKTLNAYSIGNGGGPGLQIGNEGNVTVMTGTTAPLSLEGIPIDGYAALPLGAGARIPDAGNELTKGRRDLNDVVRRWVGVIDLHGR